MNFSKKIMKNPPVLICLSFFIVIFFGAFLLNLPIASQNGRSVGFIDALFTATSATCVTGLITVNTANYWTVFGKVVIILLIQTGGLGTMVVISLISLAFGRRINLSQRLLIKEQLSSISMTGIVKLTKYVINFSLAVELIGAFLLSFRLIPDFGWKKGILFSLFHSVSAFCNAGFDLFGDSLVRYEGSFLINFTIGGLIIVGGLGFTVFSDIYHKKHFKNFNLHTKVVLVITAILIFVGTLLIFIFEYHGEAMEGFSLKEKFLGSFFMSVTARTAGFNTINIGKLTGPSELLTIILMFIGASPASTGGGIKTTTFGVLLFSTISVLKGNNETVIFKKTIPLGVVLKSLCIFFVGTVLVVGVSMWITLIQGTMFNYIDILFETVSAFGTVGVTRGITPDLKSASKLILTLVMYMGRVGPTTLAVALVRRRTKGYTRYSEGNIIVG